MQNYYHDSHKMSGHISHNYSCSTSTYWTVDGSLAAFFRVVIFQSVGHAAGSAPGAWHLEVVDDILKGYIALPIDDGGPAERASINLNKKR